MRRVCALALLVFVIAWATPAAAQRTTGEILGKVIDESGGVLPGVTVTLRGAAVQGDQTSVSSEAGVFRFPLLPPGSYGLEYMLEGFATIRQEAVAVAVGSIINISTEMKLSTLNESVTVTGDAPVVNVVTAEVSTSYNREFVENAPVRRFSYFDLINSAPGVSSTSNVGTSTSAQALGSSTNENSYQIDGTDISSTPWPNTDVIEEVQVLQLGASAEYGNVQGAVFNIVTRQGSNQFHGDSNFYYQNNALTARNTTSAVDRGFPYNRERWRDWTLQAGGPFLTDKFWFFGSLQIQQDYDSQPGVNPAFPTKTDTKRVFWKFNYSINPKHRLMHGWHDDYYTTPEVASLFTAPSTLSYGHGDNPTPNIVYTGVLTDKTFLEARWSGFYLQSSTDPLQPGVARVQARIEDQDTGQITGGITNWAENRSWRWGYQTKLTHFIEKAMGASHDLKTGFQYGGHGSDSLTGNNDVLQVYSVTGRATTGTTQVPFHQGAKVLWTGAYVDDNMRFGRASLTLGLRYDYSRAMYPSLPFLDAVGNATGQVSQANDNLYSWNTFSPRLGFNYQVNESARTVIKAHYGRYYKAMEQAEFRPAVPSVSPAFSFTQDATGNRSNFVRVSSNANLRIDPNFQSAYNDQYIVQLEQELVTNVGLQVNYVHKQGEDYGGWQDIAGTYQQVPYIDSVGADATGQTLMLYRLTSNPASRVFLQTNPEGLYMRYNGVAMQLTKRMANKWQAVFSTVLSKSEGRLGSSARATATTAQSSQALTFGRDAAGPNDFVNTDGRLIGDRPVVMKLQLTYRLPWSLLVAANLQHQTGRLYTRQLRIAGLGFPVSPIINMEPNTGDRRVAPTRLFDVRVQRSFEPAAIPMKLEVFVDALNLTNNDVYEGVGSTLGSSSAFGVPTRYVPPRRVQLGAKVRW